MATKTAKLEISTMDWDEARVQTTEEPFNGGLLVHVFYDGLYISQRPHA